MTRGLDCCHCEEAKGDEAISAHVDMLKTRHQNPTLLSRTDTRVKSYTASRARSLQWLSILLFLWLSSLVFACLFEWQRYQVIGGATVQTMPIVGKIFLISLLMAKSLCWFLPFLPLWGILVAMRFWRTTVITLNLFWIVMFYFMGLDLVSVGFAGYHLWDYIPNVEDFWKNPDMKVWQWAGGQLTAQAFSIFVIFALSGPLLFYGAMRIVSRLADRFRWISLPSSLTALTSVLVLFVLGPIPVGGSLPDRVLSALPVSDNMKRLLGSAPNDYAAHLGLSETPVVRSEFLRIGHATAASVNRFFPGKPDDGGGDNPQGYRSDVKELVGSAERQQVEFPAVHSAPVTRDDELTATHVLQDAVEPGPMDTSAFVKKDRLPNVILIIFESFRYSALSPDLMKDLDTFSERGLRLQRHYAGSNCSHLGLFSLFYSRIPLGYHKTLDRKIPAQMLESLRRSGYEITFLTAGETKGFRRLDEFINNKSCDHFLSDGEFSVNGMDDWPNSDRRKLARVKTIVNDAADRPQFIFFYLVSSHYRYAFPSEFTAYKEASHFWGVLNPTTQIQNHLNRYMNSCLFLEHEVLDLARAIDPNRNIIIITGDHGESMGEDGVFTHGSRMSEIQMRVPFIMVGPGVEPRKIATATVHSDVLPTLLHVLSGHHVPVKYSHGRDLIADSSPADEVIVVPANGPGWDRIMLIRGDNRLLFKPVTAHGKNPVMKFEGMVDEVGDYLLKVSSSLGPQHGTEKQ